jgi:O-antigen ligase
MPRVGTHALIAGALWGAVWFSINTGPWTLSQWPPEGLIGWGHYIRTLFPFAVVCLLPLGVSLGTGRWWLSGPLRLWAGYGLVVALASLVSLEPFDAFWWSCAYLAVLGAAWVFVQARDPLRQAVYLNWLSWFITSAFLLSMLILARESLFSSYQASGSLYGAYGQQSEVVGMAMSRSSGLARFAAVPGLVALVFLFRGGFWTKIIFGLVGIGSAWFIYNMQSRGAIFGLAASVLFLMLAGGRTLRFVGISVVALIMFSVATGVVPEGTVERIREHLSRGQSAEEFASMTGRTRTWEVAWAFAQDSLFYGHGMQADRFLFREHVHNTYMYALLAGGLVGLALFLAGLVWAWTLMVRLSLSRLVDHVGERTHFLQASAILVFFSVRSVTEVSGAMFAVDLVVMVPAILYLTILNQHLRAWRDARSERSKATVQHHVISWGQGRGQPVLGVRT